MRIRPATEADLARLRELTTAAFAPYVERIDREPAPMAMDHAREVAAGNVRVAVLDGDVLGFTVLAPGADHLLLDVIAVDPAVGSTGVGTRLLADAEAQAAAGGFPEVRLCTNEAMTENLEWYPRRGYRENHRARQHGFDRVFFTKQLAPDAAPP